MRQSSSLPGSSKAPSLSLFLSYRHLNSLPEYNTANSVGCSFVKINMLRQGPRLSNTRDLKSPPQVSCVKYVQVVSVLPSVDSSESTFRSQERAEE